jgi:hypothetical protein
MAGDIRWNGNGAVNGAGVYELALAEHLSWQISIGLAVGDAREFDLWLSRLWREGEPGTQLQEKDALVTVRRPVADDKTVEWWADGDWIIGLVRYLNGHYLVTGPELTRMPCIFDLDLEPLE